MATRWTQFLKRHSGKGYTREELSKMYRKASPSSEGYRAARPSSASRYRKASPSKAKRSKKTSKSSSKEKCRSLLSKKIKINMDEYRSGRWSSPKQAIAVSYSQIQKKHPKCKRHLARKTSKK